MKIKKIFLSLLSLTFLLFCSGKLSARQTDDIRVRCEYLVEQCSFYDDCNWKSYVLARQRIIGEILDLFCKNHELFRSKTILELKGIISDKLGRATLNWDIEAYDRRSIMCSESYEDFVYNLSTVYLTYVDLSDPVLLAQTLSSYTRSLNCVELFWRGKTVQDIQKRMRVWEWSVQNGKRVHGEIGRRMQLLGLSVLPDKRSGKSAVSGSAGSPVPESVCADVSDTDSEEEPYSVSSSPSLAKIFDESKDDGVVSSEKSDSFVTPVFDKNSRSCRNLPAVLEVPASVTRSKSVSGELGAHARASSLKTDDSPYRMSDFVACISGRKKATYYEFGNVTSSGVSTPTALDEDGKPLPPLKFGDPTKLDK